ncbi:MAG TPA: hypothetical protein VKE98_18820 [Gemmataceae bacterium]|nr:hypothetical protein [Gemmataceae bacterium]
MIGTSDLAGTLSDIGRSAFLSLFLLLAFLAGPAVSQKQGKIQSTVDEDAETFLPNPVPLQGQLLPIDAVAFHQIARCWHWRRAVDHLPASFACGMWTRVP